MPNTERGTNMSKKSLEDIRHSILTRMEENYKKEMVPAILSDMDENGVEILTVDLFNFAEDGFDADGEFFFLPSGEEDEVQFFVNLITIAEELPEENLPELCVAVSSINTYILTGAFAIDVASKSLVYKHTYEMLITDDEEKTMDNAELSMGTALEMVNSYAYMLAEVNAGKRSAESVIRTFAEME